MTKRERKERNLQKRLEWADKREQKAKQEQKISEDLVKNIPLGQPVLTGHHSEKRHRKTLKRSRDHATKNVENLNMAKYHKDKAENIQYQLNNTIFSDDIDAIQRLKEKINGLEKQRKRMKEINKSLKTGSKIELSDEEIKILKSNKKIWGEYKFMSYELTNIGQRIRQTKKRLEKLERK